jgi:hypothetical protein
MGLREGPKAIPLRGRPQDEAIPGFLFLMVRSLKRNSLGGKRQAWEVNPKFLCNLIKIQKMNRQNSLPSCGLHILGKIIHKYRFAGRRSQLLQGQLINAGVGLPQMDVSRKNADVENRRGNPGGYFLFRPGPGIGKDPGSSPSAQSADQRQEIRVPPVPGKEILPQGGQFFGRKI